MSMFTLKKSYLKWNMSSKPKRPSVWLVPNKKAMSKMPPKYKGKPPRDRIFRRWGGFSRECRVEEPVPGAQSHHRQFVSNLSSFCIDMPRRYHSFGARYSILHTDSQYPKKAMPFKSTSMYWTGACSMPVVLLLLLVSYAFRPTSCRKDPAKREKSQGG